MSNVLIAGCGDVGCALGMRLVDAGNAVWGLRRRVGSLPAAIRPVAADLRRPEHLAALPKGLEVVVYVVAATEFTESAYRDAYVSGLRNLLGALQTATQPVRRVVLVSSTGVYGQSEAEWVDEESSTRPESFSGRVLLEGESVALRGPFAATVVRFGGIYGPGRNRLIESVRRGDACADSPPVYTNRIHRDDCAGVLQHLIALEHPASVYLGVDSCPAPQCEVMDWLAAQLGVDRPARRATNAGGSPQRGNKRCRNDRLVDTGYRFRYPSYREGYAEVLRGLGA